MKITSNDWAFDRAYWFRKAKENGVPSYLFCKREERGWNWKDCADPKRYNRWSRRDSIAEAARESGLNVRTFYRFLARNPEYKDRPMAEVAEKIKEHKAAGWGGER